MSEPAQRWADLLQGGTEGILLRLIALTPPLLPGSVDEPSRVTLLLKSGREVTGNLLGRSEGRGQAYLLSGPSGSQRGRPELFVAEADSIAAVTIHDPDWFARCIEDERKPSPTRLELQRQAAEISKALQAATGLALELEIEFVAADPPGANRSLGELLRCAQIIFKEIPKDEMGRAALAKFKKIRIGQGTALTVAVQGDVLALAAPLGLGKAPSEAVLREAIEKAL
jgi:hypothetical protein